MEGKERQPQIVACCYSSHETKIKTSGVTQTFEIKCFFTYLCDALQRVRLRYLFGVFFIQLRVTEVSKDT